VSRILLVEDHRRMAALIRQALEKAGVAVDAFEQLEPAWSASRQITYGAMVVDRGLPDGRGSRRPLRADRGALFTLLKNLLENAIQHSRTGGVVELRADARLISVQDEGTGVSAEDRISRTETAHQ
jgi:signal transduction histidine kinase